MPKTSLDTLSNLLVQSGILTLDDISKVVHSQLGPDETIDMALIQRGLISKNTLLTLLTDHYKVPFVAEIEKVDIQILKLVPEYLIEGYQAVPIRFEEGILTLAMTAPDDLGAIHRIRAVTGFNIRPVGILEGGFRKFYAKYFEDSTMAQILKEIELHQRELELQETPTTDLEKSRPMAKLVDSILLQAVRKRASDVHIEPQENFALLRLRVDGILKSHQVFPKSVLLGLTNRVKVLSHMDITERRLPQDGQFRHKLDDREVDVRVSCVPSHYGEKIALRVLDRRSFLMNLDLLGMPPEVQALVEETVGRPNGLFLVTGPTGSGKTTTLYSIIQRLRSPQLNIMTLEDPIEYELLAGSRREGGITQIQINSRVGLTFASGLRACLRQDPDILFVGEIRDKETAETGISAALTGHMVLSSLHTNGAVQTVARLMDMGVEPYLVGSALRAVVAQRLVRLLCHQCKLPYTPPQDALVRLGLDVEEGRTLFKPNGCVSCMQQGYWGRTGVFELLALDNNLVNLVIRKAPIPELFGAARERGFKTLKDNGLDLAAQGLTSIEEVLRVLPSV